MHQDANTPKLYSDAALKQPDSDQLGYREYAADIATTLDQSIPQEEFIVGINGQWGSGKSTIINFIDEELQAKPNPPTIIRFNPWWFSDDVDLIEKFLSQISASLQEYKKYDELRDQISRYANAFSKIPFSAFGVPVNKAAKAVADISKADPINIDELQIEIAEHLQSYDSDIVVIIDDIDRLSPEKIRHMFRVIKSVAAFPSITYVVALDQDVVTDALEGYEGVDDGQEYLDKLIQLPLDVPQPKEGTLHQFLSERLNQILYQSDAKFDDDRWNEVYHVGIRPIVETPRDAIRLANAVSTTIQGIDSEVNFVDLVCVETIRLHAPQVYQEMKESKDTLTFQKSYSSNNTSEGDPEEIFEDINLEDSEEIKIITFYLFPNCFSKLTRSLEGTSYEDNGDYFKRNRICNESKFSIYFRQSISEAEVPESVFSRGIKNTQFVDKFEEFLSNQLDNEGPTGRTGAYNFMAELHKRYDECLDVDTTLTVLLTTGDDLVIADPPRNRLDIGVEEYIVKTAGRLIADENQTNRFNLLKNVVSRKGPSYIKMELLNRLDQGILFGTNLSDDQDALLTSEQLTELRKMACDQVYQADFEELIEVPHIHEVLNYWTDWEERNQYEEWSEKHLSDEKNIFKLLNGLVETGQIYSTGKSGKVEYLDPNWLKPLISPEEALNRITGIGQLDKSQKHLYKILKHGIDILNKDRDPKSMQEWEQLNA